MIVQGFQTVVKKPDAGNGSSPSRRRVDHLSDLIRQAQSNYTRTHDRRHAVIAGAALRLLARRGGAV